MVFALAANFFGSLLPKLIYILVTPIMVRVLGIEAMGIIGLQVMVVTATSIFHQSLGKTVNRVCAHSRAQTSPSDARIIAGIEQAFWIIGGGLMLLSGPGADLIARDWLGPTKMPHAEVVVSLILIIVMSGFQILQLFYYNGLLGFGRHKAANSYTGIGELLRYGGTIPLLLLFHASLVDVLIWQTALAGLQSLAMVWAFWRQAPFAHPRTFTMFSALHEIRAFAAGMMIITALAVLTSQADRLVLSFLMPLAVFGQYTVISNLARSVPLLVAPISNVFFPKLTEDLVDPGADISRDYHKYAELVAAVSIPPSIFLAAYAHDVLSVYVGAVPWIDQASPALVLLSFAMMLAALYEAPYILQLAGGWTSLHAKLQGGVLVPLMVTYWILAKLAGSTGVAIAVLALCVSYLVIGIPIMHRKLLMGQQAIWLKHDILRPVFVTLLSCVLSLAVSSLFSQPLIRLVVAVPFGLISMVAICLTGPATSGFVRGALKYLATRNGATVQRE